MAFTMKKTVCGLVCTAGLVAGVGSLAFAQKATDAKPGAAPAAPQAMPLPPGWTQADMDACMAAMVPGEQQANLCKGAGVWHGKNTMWMYPGAEPMKSECTNTVTAILDGRYIQSKMTGDFPGMGTFTGMGLVGFDNVSQKYVGTWVDSYSTGIMNGVGSMTPDGKVMNWSYTFNCPMTKKPAKVRQVEKFIDENTMTFDMYMTDPKSGQEYQNLHIEFTRGK